MPLCMFDADGPLSSTTLAHEVAACSHNISTPEAWRPMQTVRLHGRPPPLDLRPQDSLGALLGRTSVDEPAHEPGAGLVIGTAFGAKPAGFLQVRC